MFALIFQFPHGRYHATPWGRHVNEGAVAWPPEPYRVLRALIATWHRKADKARWDEPALHRLVEALAASDPVYRLPNAVHAHTRHYMPQGQITKEGREQTSLVFDAFHRIGPQDELVMAWPDVTLDAEDFALAENLAALIGYLGRAESVVIARATDAVDGPFPVAQKLPEAAGWKSVDVLAPLSPSLYAASRPALLARNIDKSKSRKRTDFEATIPGSITAALRVETSQLQAVGWSRPPAGRLVSYAVPEIGPRPSAYGARPIQQDDPTRFQVARFILAGRPLPPITDAVKLGEVFRQALMARVAEPVPAVLSGRDEAGAPLRDPQHAHAFFLPEDHDEDGLIDHLLLYARPGFCHAVRRAADGLHTLWIKDRAPRDADEATEQGRREWRVALEGFGTVTQFNDSALLRPSRIWASVTPYLRPRYLKGKDPVEQTRRMVCAECEHRGWPVPDVQYEIDDGRSIRTGGQTRNVLAFHRFRGRRGLTQPDRTGLALRLEFPQEISGPLALGFGCHFGLGLFRAVTD